MKLGVKSIVLGTSFLFAVGAFAASNQPTYRVCVSERPKIGQQKTGYELIDFIRGEAWVTLDWTLEDYSNYSLGITSLNWFKNAPRISSSARASILKSPDCENNGEFTYQHMHGRSFFHIADIKGIGTTYGENDEIQGANVKKYHKLEFDPGQTVMFLVSPENDYFVRVNSPVRTGENDAELPEAWTIQEFDLESAWQVELFEEVQVYQVKDGTSFQGPVNPPTGEYSYKDSKATEPGQHKT